MSKHSNLSPDREYTRRRPILRVIDRYLRKSEQASENYFRHITTNRRRSKYWYRQSVKWLNKIPKQFPWFNRTRIRTHESKYI